LIVDVIFMGGFQSGLFQVLTLSFVHCPLFAPSTVSTDSDVRFRFRVGSKIVVPIFDVSARIGLYLPLRESVLTLGTHHPRRRPTPNGSDHGFGSVTDRIYGLRAKGTVSHFVIVTRSFFRG
jgi:hypothetical protein